MSLTASDSTTEHSQVTSTAVPISKLNSAKRYLLAVLLRHWLLLVLTFVALVVRLLTAPTFVETREGIFYVRGVVRYSVIELRPYWPGYPVYMWAGKLINLVFADPAFALRLVSVLASTLSLWPLASLSAAWCRAVGGNSSQSKLAAYTAALLWILLPISWLTGSEILGDPLALFLGLVLLWLCWKALEPAVKPHYFLLIAGVIAGLMLGVRLAYLPFLVLLAYACWRNRQQMSGPKKTFFTSLPFLTLLSFGATVIVWLGWQIWVDGFRFFQVGSSQLSGHYLDWGNSAISDQNLLARPARLLRTYLEYGLGGWWPGLEWSRLPLTIGLGLFVILGIKQLTEAHQSTPRFLVLFWFGSYTVCTLLNYDVDLTRYTFPLVAISCIVAALGIAMLPKYRIILAIVTVVTVAVVSVPLALEHHTSTPAGVGLSNYINTTLDPATSTIIINDDTASLIFFMQENAPKHNTLRVKEAELYPAIQANETVGRTVYATWLEGDAPQDWVLVKAFERNLALESRGPLMVGLYRHTSTTKP